MYALSTVIVSSNTSIGPMIQVTKLNIFFYCIVATSILPKTIQKEVNTQIKDAKKMDLFIHNLKLDDKITLILDTLWELFE